MKATPWVLGCVLVAAMVTLSPNTASAIVTAEEAALVPSGLSSSAALGSAMASSADGSRVIVGAPMQAEGRAYVFVRVGTGWSLQATLVHPSPASGDRFGASVGISDDGTRVVVGAPGKNRAYAFHFPVASWVLEATYIPSAGNVGSTESFGAEVAISGDGLHAVIGSPNFWDTMIQQGRISIFRRTGTTWLAEQVVVGIVASDALGSSLALDATGTRLAVGVPYWDGAASQGGAAFLYLRAGTTWTREAVLLPTGLVAGAGAGRQVAISASGDRVLVGIQAFRMGTLGNAGAATIFARAGTTWAEETRLVSSAPRTNDYLGSSVALSTDGSRALLGASGGTGTGSARMYLRRGAVWMEEGVLSAAGGAAGDSFGVGVALAGDGSRAFVGGPDHDGTASDAGAARVFTVGDAIGTVCASGELCMTGICIDGVCCENACGDGAVDCLGCSAALNGVADGRCLPARIDTPCRAAIGLCDIPEVCDGSLTLCPPDSLAMDGTECRPEIHRDCDVAEVCDGVTAECPEDVFAPPDTMCGDAPSGMCDVMDVCEGSRCRPTFQPAGTECGDAVVMGVCDTPDVCTGDRADCPPTFLSGVVCRVSGDGCDLPEVCTGTSRSCPPDQVAGAGVVCRASVMERCDPVESCDGASPACPADLMTCMEVPDAGPSTADAGTPSAAAGCSCRAAAPSRPSLAWLALIVLGVLTKRRAIPPAHVG